MSAETLHRLKWFWAWQDEQEEAWLRQMSQSGWHLTSVTFPNWYEFERSEPRDYVYRLDFNPDWRNTDEYLRLFADAGWAHVGHYGSWQYFRIEARPGEDPQIYTDNASKVTKYQRVIGTLVAILPLVLFWATRSGSSGAGLQRAFGLAGALFLMVYIYAMVMLLRRVAQLRRWPG